MKRTKGSGFTLLELLIVVIIVGILATFAIPQFLGFVDRSREGEATNLISSILTAELLYFQENGQFSAVPGDLALNIPSNPRHWSPIVSGTSIQVPGTATGTPALTGIGTTNVRVFMTTPASGSPHSHTATGDHEVEGWIDNNGNKAIRVDRNDGTDNNWIQL